MLFYLKNYFYLFICIFNLFIYIFNFHTSLKHNLVSEDTVAQHMHSLLQEEFKILGSNQGIM